MDSEGRWYTIRQGKTDNAARVVPLVGMAQDVIKARLGKVKGDDPLFGEVPVRKSTGKRGGSLSQAFSHIELGPRGADPCFRKRPHRHDGTERCASGFRGEPTVAKPPMRVHWPRSWQGSSDG